MKKTTRVPRPHRQDMRQAEQAGVRNILFAVASIVTGLKGGVILRGHSVLDTELILLGVS
jgi:hypothetical protein